MSKMERTTCDGCGAVMTADRAHLQLSCWMPWPKPADTGISAANARTDSDVQLLNTANPEKDFCSLRCLYDWATALVHGT